MKYKQPNIKLLEYERIFRTIDGVLISEGADPVVSCLYFGIFGAHILNLHHKIKAQAVVGMGLFRPFSESDLILAQATLEQDRWSSSKKGFHCWVEADDQIIDFSSPLFQEMFAKAGKPIKIDRKMLNKPISQMSDSPNQLKESGKSGDFFYMGNPMLTADLIGNLYSKQMFLDLLHIHCETWYSPYPKKMDLTKILGDARGNTIEARLSPLSLTGVW